MAFALLTGNLPFRRQESMATLFAHLNDPVPPLSRYRGDLPPGTDAVLARGLAKVPGDRYARCGEFAAALRGALAGTDGQAGPWPAGPGAGAQTRLESAPAAPRPHLPTAVWPGTVSEPAPATETLGSPPAGSRPSYAGASHGQPPYAGAPQAGQSWAEQATSARSQQAAPRPAAPAPSPPTWPAQSPGVGGRPVTHRPPPAAGQGGKLPLVSKSAVIATLAAIAALVLLYLLHGGH